MRRFLFGMVVVVLLILTVFLVFVDMPKKSSEEPVTSTTEQKKKQLYDYSGSDNSKVVFTHQGKIVGDDKYKSVRVTVTKTKRTIELLSGYNQRVEKKQDFTNDQAAYETFLRALDVAGFTKTKDVANSDERGVCPLGHRYVFQLFDGSEQIQRTWSNTCSEITGTYAGSRVTKDLFEDQITDYNEFMNRIYL